MPVIELSDLYTKYLCLGMEFARFLPRKVI